LNSVGLKNVVKEVKEGGGSEIMGNFFYRESGCEHRAYVKTTSYEPAPDRDDVLVCKACGKERLVWSLDDEMKWRYSREAA